MPDGATAAARAARAWRCSSSLRATAASCRCWTWRSRCSPSPTPSTSPTSARPPARSREGPFDLTLIDGSITTARDARSDPRGAPAQPLPGVARGLRHHRRDPGAAQLRRRRRDAADRLRHARVHRHAGDVDRHLRSRPGRLRAARLSAQSPSASGGGERVPEPPDARDLRPQRLPRVQAARQRLRDGDGDALPGPGHARRLRRDLPRLRPRLLRLLRPDGGAQHRVAGPGVRGRRKDAPGSPARVPHLQRQRPRLPRGEPASRGRAPPTTGTAP